jgi:type I restriction enzyme, S subunit
VSEADFDNYRANRRPERGDILMTRVGAGIGEAAVLNSDFEFAFYVSLCLIKVPNQLVSVDYLVLWLNSPEGRESSKIRTNGKGASQGNLNLGLIRTFKIPLPPLAEQHRIVAKVDALMALCDRLEANLTATAGTRRRLLDALLAEALAPVEDHKMEAALVIDAEFIIMYKNKDGRTSDGRSSRRRSSDERVPSRENQSRRVQ